ncbi:MAG: hypothetical protein GWP30_04060 [Actinobacteria bacterium]|nr:hypothetical protein [Actinomycetota bacterium]
MTENASLNENTVGLSASQTSFLALVMGGLLGFAGLLSLALMVWFSHRNFGIDRSAKHGISVKNTSRLGGVAIAVFFILWSVGSSFQADLFSRVPGSLEPPSFWWIVLALGLIGLLDDFRVSLSPSIRLIACGGILTSGFLLNPELMPQKVLLTFGLAEVPGADVLLLASAVFVGLGFINAANMADGANGLLGGIVLAFFVCTWLLTSNSFYFTLSLGLVGFLLVNTLSGRIILGDFGSYGLAALVVLESFELYDSGRASLFFLVSLLSYPCLEILRIFWVRVRNGQSPFIADNQHSHNLLNTAIQKVAASKTTANSLTGMAIAITSVAPSLTLFYFQEQTNEVLCGLVSLGQVSCFLAAYLIFRPNKTPRELLSTAQTRAQSAAID